jgi:hypothetical protein
MFFAEEQSDPFKKFQLLGAKICGKIVVSKNLGRNIIIR